MFEKFDDMLYGWCWEESYTAAHEIRPTMQQDNDRELLLTRTKLEVRTWLLRITIGLLTGSWAGFFLALATDKIQIRG